jgi:hypothetical protein
MTKSLLKPLLPLLVLAALVAGCGSESAQEAGPVPTGPAASGTDTAPTETTPTETTPAETTEPSPSTEPSPVNCDSQTGGEEGIYTNLVDVRVGSHAGFDRVVFEFEAPDAKSRGETGIPRFVIKAAKPPFTEDPSDLPIDVEGGAFARIVLQGASGYDFDGNATYDGTRRLMPGYETLTDVVQGGDFEATMTWIFGLTQRSCWQIQELHNPDRLVIDFHHVDV